MSILIAVDDSNIAEAIVRAVAPSLRRSQTTAHLITVVDPREARGRRRGSEPASYHSETMPADLSGGRLPGSTTGGPVLPPVAEDRTQALESLEDERRHYLDHLAEQHLSGVTCEIRVVASENAAQAIADLADEVGAETIAIGTHGRTGFRRALMGSVAERVVRSSNVPVLMVREGMRVPAE